MAQRATAVALFLLVSLAIVSHAAPLRHNRRAASRASTTSSTSTSAASLPSASAPALNWAAYGNGTTGSALHQLLVRIAPDAPQRWATALITSTQIGSDNPAGSNADLYTAADALDFPATSAGSVGRGWVETYIEFLLEAGVHNTTAENELLTLQNETTKAWAMAQEKLVRAYMAAHPGNVTSVGVNVAGTQKIDAVTLGPMIEWAWQGGDAHCVGNSTGNCKFDSDEPYTEADYKNFQNATAAYASLQTWKEGYDTLTQMQLEGYQLKTLFPTLGIFNLSMDVGGSGSFTQYAPSWSATIIGFAKKDVVGDGMAVLESNLDDASGEATSNSTGGVPGLLGRKAEAAPRFSALQALAPHIDPPKNVAPGPVRLMMVDSVAANAAAASSSDPLNQPLAPDQTFMLLNLQEGAWADKRAKYISAARQSNPAVVDKYFGPAGSGAGLIGRRWTHLVLRTSFRRVGNSTQVNMVELFGKVYGVVPV
ncbi:hypothetical protein B0H15DRAFT_796004 [Mycena belliarum]|uniref:Uncharacterized protein n=1 Tax=Mycena belliarum TaxID=1033014 RepID=A0AAD6UGJ6_9AGAR|nr:hypothetical protein B0H15DRAFT_796004 [Mycena belliae]